MRRTPTASPCNTHCTDTRQQWRQTTRAHIVATSRRSSILDCSTISEVLDRRDQLPLGPHANRVFVHRLVDDLKRHKRGQFEILQTDADLGGTLSDKADVRRGGDDFVDSACALFGTADGERKRQPNDRLKLVSVKLKERGQVRNEIKHPQVAHSEAREIRQPAQLGRQPVELIVVELKRRLGSDRDR